MKQTFTLFFFSFLSAFSLYSQDTEPPVPYGPVPTPEQVRWHQMEYYMFIHFGFR